MFCNVLNDLNNEKNIFGLSHTEDIHLLCNIRFVQKYNIVIINHLIF